jgi:hypothetical protein
MKKLMTAALGLSLLSGTAVFAQNTSGAGTAGTDTGTMKSKKKSKKKKGGADTGATTSGTSNK